MAYRLTAHTVHGYVILLCDYGESHNLVQMGPIIFGNVYIL
jgi:hypothetical protein